MSGAAVGRYLSGRGVAFALIGAQAMVLRGIVRFSLDIDFLTVDRAVLSPEFWGELPDAAIDVRCGDLTDPLAGVVRIAFPQDPVDVVVGKYKWQRPIVERAEPLAFDDVEIPVARKADLVLLKLFAGGPQDMWDVHALLAADSTIAADVDRLVVDLPHDAQRLWENIRSEAAD